MEGHITSVRYKKKESFFFLTLSPDGERVREDVGKSSCSRDASHACGEDGKAKRLAAGKAHAAGK